MRRIIFSLVLCLSLANAEDIKFEAFGLKLGDKLDLSRKDLKAYEGNSQKKRGYKIIRKPIGNLISFVVSIDAFDRIYQIHADGDDVTESECKRQAVELSKYFIDKYKVKARYDGLFKFTSNNKNTNVGCQSAWKKLGMYHLTYYLTDSKKFNSLDSILSDYLKLQSQNTKQYKGL